MPVPGWTLPGVMTTGAAQTLLKTDGVLPGRRVVVCGNGPLNLQVALELARAGAEVVAVAELAERPGLAKAGPLLRLMSSAFDLAWQGATMLRELRPAPHPAALWAGPDARRAVRRARSRASARRNAASRSMRC